MTRTRLLIAIAVAALVSACRKDVPDSMRVDMLTIKSMVIDLRGARSDCPTVEQLVADRRLSQGSTDAWGTTYVVECSGAKVAVRSAGPDKKLKTDDDVLVE